METISLIVVEWVLPPPVPVRVIVYVPGDTEEATDRVSIDENVGSPDEREKASVTPRGCPERLRTTFFVDPESRFTVTV